MTRRETASLLGVTTASVAQYLHRGILTGTKTPTGAWDVNPASVLRYHQRRTQRLEHEGRALQYLRATEPRVKALAASQK